MTDLLGNAYPGIARQLKKQSLATLPTPVSSHEIDGRTVFVKHDSATNALYGGNKIRKLEYLFARALERGAEQVVTFGAAGSNHALATAMHAKKLGLACTCFLANQKPTPNVPRTLLKHLEIGTRIVRYGGGTDTLALYREHIQGHKAWVIPLGGTCWYAAAGFVNAGLELAGQIANGELETPSRIYIANGTMGSVAGLSIGLALADLPIDIHAVRVATNMFAKPDVLERLIRKTAYLLHRLDPAFPVEVANQTRIVWRDEFYAGGYAAVDDTTRDAVDFAGEHLDLSLDTTYTGKAMAALVADAFDAPVLFWNTYSAAPIRLTGEQDTAALPPEFLRYFD